MFTVKAPRNPNRPDRRQVPRHLEDRGFEPRVREREFGIGYGRSSGYGGRGNDSYIRSWRPSSFRVG